MRIFALKNRSRVQSPWVYEALDPGKKVLGTFPTAAMAERKLRELGIEGTIRPSKRTVEEALEIAKQARKPRLLRGKTKTKPIVAPKKSKKAVAVPEQKQLYVGTVHGGQLKAFIDKFCAIGGSIPLIENPM